MNSNMVQVMSAVLPELSALVCVTCGGCNVYIVAMVTYPQVWSPRSSRSYRLYEQRETSDCRHQ